MDQSTNQSDRVYAPGYDNKVTRTMAARAADTHAAFLLPHLSAGARLLDCGCGPGSISVGLAQRIAPGELVGIDLSEEQLEMARTLVAQRGLDNARFQRADVYALPFPNESFDAVYASALMDWLVEPARALTEIRRVLKPGGIVALASADVEGHLNWPRQPMEEFWKLTASMVTISTKRPWTGRDLGQYLREAGFPAPTLSARYEMLDPVEFGITNGTFFQGQGRERVLGAGLADAATLDRLREEVERFTATPGVMMAFAWIEALARK